MCKRLLPTFWTSLTRLVVKRKSTLHALGSRNGMKLIHLNETTSYILTSVCLWSASWLENDILWHIPFNYILRRSIDVGFQMVIWSLPLKPQMINSGTAISFPGLVVHHHLIYSYIHIHLFSTVSQSKFQWTLADRQFWLELILTLQVKIGSSEQLKASDSIKQVSWRTWKNHCICWRGYQACYLVKGEIHVLLGNKNAIPYHVESTVCFFCQQKGYLPARVKRIQHPQSPSFICRMSSLAVQNCKG